MARQTGRQAGWKDGFISFSLLSDVFPFLAGGYKK